MRALAVLVMLAAGAAEVAAQQPVPPPAPDPKQPQFAETVDVVAVTPLHGVSVPKSMVAANVQVFATPALPQVAAGDLGRLLSERAASVHVNDSQAGTFQPDVLFRGFAGSPLLGSSEGLAVYQDGVRINEAFGDTINWDALPSLAIASVNVMPGSNPLFGLNTLGGAVSLRTRDGFAYPGAQAAFRAGSFGRYDLEGAAGGHGKALGYYLAGSIVDEDGWRDFSPSTVRRIFGDLAWRGGVSQVNVSLTGASNDLTGNGPAPLQLLDQNSNAVFTYPDRTDNDLTMVTVRAVNPIADVVAYYRRSAVATFNGDSAGDEAEGTFDALNNRSHTRTHAAGATTQLVRRAPLWRRDNILVAGAGFDTAATGFDFGSEFARLTPDRGTTGSGLFDDNAAVGLHSRSTTASAFASNIWSPTRSIAITASARFNWTDVRLRDQIGTALNGDHHFARINPAAGITYQVSPAVNVYGSYAQSSRVPTPVELTCADPEDPCRLPNAFVSDPPLDQIVATTWEAGARGAAGLLSWSVSAYSTTVSDDVIFVSSGTLRGEGHFENVNRTVRTGMEASVSYDVRDRVSAFANFTLQRATFGSDLVISSRFHPLAVDTEIAVAEGSWLPGIPAGTAKVGVSGRITAGLQAGVSVRAQSGQFLRGDEANLLERVPGFAVVDLHARQRVTSRVAVVGQLLNVFDTGYYTFGVLGDATLIDPDLGSERFVSPGAPRAGWIGVEVRF